MQKGNGWTKSWSVVVDNYNYFRSEEYAMYEVSIGRDESIEEAISKYDIRMGDLIYFCKEKGPTHTAIISSVQKDEILYAGHTKPRWNKKLSETFDENEDYTNVIIVCLNGRVPA